jgi:3-dehydroquinate dehydratase type I
MKKPNIKKILSRTNVVGVIASLADLQMAVDRPDDADIYEYRADKVPQLAFHNAVKNFSERNNKPIILTFRHTSEGGERDSWGGKSRTEILMDFMPIATFIDIEAATAEHNADLIEHAKQSGVGVIISDHILNEAYNTERTDAALAICRKYYGDVFKIALNPKSLTQFGEFIADVSELIEWELSRVDPTSIAAMAIGDKYGKVSRLLFGTNKSPFVYGSLSRGVVAGQWPVGEIRKMLAKMS